MGLHVRTVRRTIGILFLVSALLWVGVVVADMTYVFCNYNFCNYPNLVTSAHVYSGTLVRYILLASASFVLLTRNENRSSQIDTRFGVVTSALLFGSAILLTGRGGLNIAQIFPNFRVIFVTKALFFASFCGGLSFLAASFIALLYSRNMQPLNLPRPRGLLFGISFLCSTILATLAFVSSPVSRIFPDIAISYTLQMGALLILLFPYISWKSPYVEDKKKIGVASEIDHTRYERQKQKDRSERVTETTKEEHQQGKSEKSVTDKIRGADYKLCTSCQNSLPLGAKFCDKCGTKQPT